jgi:hypothetical protein
MAFDLEEAARQGRSGTIPAEWTIFRVARGALWLNLLSYAACALLLLGVAAYLFVSNSALLPGNSANASPISPLEAAAFVVLGFIFLIVVVRLLPALINEAGHFFLVTREGFVAVAGRRVVGLPFGEMKTASREAGLLGAKLVVQRKTGKTLVLPLGRIYGTRALRQMEEVLTTGINAPNDERTGKRKKSKRA